MKKLLLAVITGWICCIPLWSYADSPYDCWLVLNGVDNAVSLYKKNLLLQNSILDEDAMKTALEHLKNYCDGKNEWLESPYIFDQLIDISFRKIDALENANLRYGLKEDSKWSEWTKKIKEFTDPENNTVPEQVVQQFTTFWPSAEAWDIPYTPWNNCYLEKYDQLSVYGRYRAACEISTCIAKNITTVLQNSESSAKLLQTDRCRWEYSVVHNRFLSEAAYVKQLLARTWMRTLTNTVQQYTSNYFISNRRQNLFDKFTQFDQYLSFVNRKVQEWTPVCSSK